jgi:ATP-binding cassette, subfamily F, member 3
MDTMAVVIASDLGKDIAGEPLLRGISFKLERRDRMTLSGRNGAGKTTLLRMLAAEASVDFGELVLAKGAKVALHDQRPPRDRGLSLRDYVLSGAQELVAIERELAGLEQEMAGGAHDDATLNRYAEAQGRLEHAGGYDWRERALATLRGLGFRADSDLDRSLETFSGGELTRASLGRALAGDPDLLLLDEPTNHLDIVSLEWLEQHLVGLDAAVVLVAHDRWFLEAVGTAVLELEPGLRPEDGHVGKFFAGPWHAWRRERAVRELALGRAVERQQAEIERLERFVTRFRAGTRARQAQSRAKKLAKIQPISRGSGDAAALEFAFKPPERSGRVVFELTHAGVVAGEKVLLEDAEMWLERGEHVSLVGPNGAGKTTLIETLAGRRELRTGKLSTGHNVKIGYLSQHADELAPGTARTVLEAAQHATGLTPGKARALLGRFLFSGEDAEKPLVGLSGGEHRRLALAILVQSGANVLILDEPTNHLDLESREALEEALGAFSGSLLLVSHDRALLDAIGTRVVAVEDRALVSYLGGWAEYIRVRDERAKSPTAVRKQAGSGPAPKPAPASARGGKAAGAGAPAARAGSRGGPRKRSANGRGAKSTANGQRELERQIEAAETALTALEQELSDPVAWSTPEASERSSASHEAAKQAVAELYERWEAMAG